jgi:hypothetical protein
LGADVTTSGNIASLQFSNLTLGKFYSIGGRVHNYDGGTITNISLTILNNSSTVDSIRLATSGTAVTSSGINKIFKANATSLIFSAGGVSANEYILGNGTSDETHIQLCELPDTYVETTEW